MYPEIPTPIGPAGWPFSGSLMPMVLPVRARESGPIRVLFLHGLGCDRSSFAEAFDAPELAGFSLLAPDLPGFGGARDLRLSEHGMDNLATAVATMLGTHEVARPHVVAHSMGGAVALRAAALGVQMASLTCVEGNLVGEDCGLLSLRSAESGPERARAVLANMRAEALRSDDPGTRRWASMAAGCNPVAFQEAAASLVWWSRSGRLLEGFGALTMPRAYVYGERSVPSPALALLPDGIERVRIEGAGHFVPGDNPAAFYEWLGGAVRRSESTGGDRT